MSQPVYFVQECPTCGRRLQIRVAYMGKRVICQHCMAEFEAYDSTTRVAPPSDSSAVLLERADELLAASMNGSSMGNGSMASGSAASGRPQTAVS